MSTASSKLHHLISEVVYDAVDLLNHRLSQNLHLDANFNCGDLPSSNGVSHILNCCLTGHNFPECAIATPCLDSLKAVCRIQNQYSTLYRLYKLWGSVDCDKIFVQMHRNVVALIRRTVFVDTAFEELLEFAQ